MFKSLSARFAKFSSLLAATTAVAFTAAAGSASAAAIQAVGGLSQVEYPNNLLIQFNGVNYIAQQSSPCSAVPANNIDTIKIWASLAQASLLSGKTMTIYFTDCTVGGTTNHYITDLVLVK